MSSQPSRPRENDEEDAWSAIWGRLGQALNNNQLSPQDTPQPAQHQRRKALRVLTSEELEAHWKSDQDWIEPLRGHMTAAAWPRDQGPSHEQIRAVGALEGFEADYSLTPTELFQSIAGSGCFIFAQSYIALAWRRLLLSDSLTSGIEHDAQVQASRKLFRDRREALDFLESCVAEAAAQRFDPAEPPLRKQPRPAGNQARHLLDRGEERKLYDKLHRQAQDAKSRYHRGELDPSTILFPGIRPVGRKRAGAGWVFIKDAGWPRQWALSVGAIPLDIGPETFKKHT